MRNQETWKCKNFKLPFTKTLLMGIVNVTPDSFSDGGMFLHPAKAIDHAHKLIEDGADIIDIGGESTRPGFTPISAGEELDRILPVIEGLKNVNIPISVDTRNHEVMKEVLKAGASIINCVDPLTALETDIFNLISKTKAGFVYTTRWESYNEDTFHYETIEHDFNLKSQMVLDLGIGFNKSRDDDLTFLAGVPRYARYFPLMIGVSRKRIIGKITGEKNPLERLGGNIGAAVWCALHNVRVLRVHEVKETRQAIDTFFSMNLKMHQLERSAHRARYLHRKEMRCDHE